MKKTFNSRQTNVPKKDQKPKSSLDFADPNQRDKEKPIITFLREVQYSWHRPIF